MAINSNKLKAMIEALARSSLKFFTAAGYGGISLQTPDASLGTVTAFEVVPFDTNTISNPRGITQDAANNGIKFNSKGVWSLNVVLALSHDELNASRQFDVQLFNSTDVSDIVTIPVGIGRNVGVTNFAGTFLTDVTTSVIGDLIQVRIGNGDTMLNVVVEFASFSASHVSELQETFA